MPAKTSLRILTVDDSPDVRRTVKAFLEKGGYTAVDEASDAREFLDRLRDNRYHVIFLDLTLYRDLTIEDTYRLFRERFPDVAVNQEEILADLGAAPSSEVDGKYLLPLAKAAQPRAMVFILTGSTDVQGHAPYFSKYKSERTVVKTAEDKDWSPDTELFGLDDQLLEYVNERLGRIVKEALTREHYLEDYLTAYGKAPSLEAFLKTHVNRFPPGAGVRLELLYFNRSQRILEPVIQVGIDRTTTQPSMLLRYVPRPEAFKREASTGTGACAYAVASKSVVLIKDVRDAGAQNVYLSVPTGQQDDTRSELVVPLLHGSNQEPIGALNLEAKVPGLFDESHVEYYSAIGPLLALMLEDEIRQKEGAIFSAAVRELASKSNPDDVLRELLDVILKMISEEYGCAMVPSGKESLRIVASRNTLFALGEEVLVSDLGIIKRAYEAMPREGDFCYWTKEEQPDLYVDVIDRRREGGKHAQVEIKSEMALRLRFNNKVLAILDVESTKMAITERFQGIILRLCEYAAALLDGMKVSRKDALLEIETLAHLGRGECFVVENRSAATARVRGGEVQSLAPDLREVLSLFRRIGNLAKSPEETESFRVDLAGRIDAVLALAINKDVHLEVVTEVPPRQVKGTLVKVDAILGNLVLNTRLHVQRQRRQAWLSIAVTNDWCRLEYWDNSGKILQEIDSAKILEGIPGHNGIPHVARTARSLGWDVTVARHPVENSYHYTFQFALLPEPA